MRVRLGFPIAVNAGMAARLPPALTQKFLRVATVLHEKPKTIANMFCCFAFAAMFGFAYGADTSTPESAVETDSRTSAMHGESEHMPGRAALSLARERNIFGATPVATSSTQIRSKESAQSITLPVDNHIFIITVLVLLGVQSVTILALLEQRRRRRRAEADASMRRSELARAARFATVGELSASIAHEVGQPLGAILSNADAAELLVKASPPDVAELQEILSDMKRDALRANDVVQRLRALLQKQSIAVRAVHIDDVLRCVLPLIEPEARRRNITLKSGFGAAAIDVMADHVQLQQVVLNLAINAMDAMQDTDPANRTLTLSTTRRANGVELAVADRGCGFKPDTAHQLFEPFYTTKPYGMGLGLSIVHSIVEAHHGHVNVALRDGGGTTVRVWLPRIHGDETRASESAGHAMPIPAIPQVRSGVGEAGRGTSF
jgi:signal transduction histidine kinase